MEAESNGCSVFLFRRLFRPQRNDPFEAGGRTVLNLTTKVLLLYLGNFSLSLMMTTDQLHFGMNYKRRMTCKKQNFQTEFSFRLSSFIRFDHIICIFFLAARRICDMFLVILKYKFVA
jgi:hypothetical protein